MFGWLISGYGFVISIIDSKPELFRTLLEFTPGWAQASEGHFWHVRCNRKLKNQPSFNLIGFFEILAQNILL